MLMNQQLRKIAEECEQFQPKKDCRTCERFIIRTRSCKLSKNTGESNITPQEFRMLTAIKAGNCPDYIPIKLCVWCKWYKRLLGEKCQYYNKKLEDILYGFS